MSHPYFREHMAERDLLFHDTVAPHLAAYDPTASEAKQRNFLTHLHQTLNAPSHPIRNRLLRLSACDAQAGLTANSLSACDAAQAGLDLLAIIKQEGRV